MTRALPRRFPLAVLPAVALAVACLPLLPVGTADAHVGSPNVFFRGDAGPYSVRATIRTPPALPGQAEVSLRVATEGVGRVTVRTARWDAGLDGAPPPEEARPVRGMDGWYSLEPWLMTPGSYYFVVAVEGTAGPGEVVIPVAATARDRLAMPVPLGAVLLLLGGVLFAGAVALAGSLARDSLRPPGAPASPGDARRATRVRWATAVGLVIVVAAGHQWWQRMDAEFLPTLHRPYDITTAAGLAEGGRWLDLTVVDEAWLGPRWTPLFPDHGKLMHMFLVREPGLDAFAHLHPVPVDERSFRVTLPPLPAGDYRVYADITQESGFAQTLTGRVALPAAPAAAQPGVVPWPAPDADDSWYAETATSMDGDPADGPTLQWLGSRSVPVDREVDLEVALTDDDGSPVSLEPYMGMLGHAAVRRRDGAVFAHLHPVGSFSMASVAGFSRREGLEADPHADSQGAHSRHGAPPTTEAGPSTVSFPYAFPRPGDYRVWIQVKARGRVITGVFDLTVVES